MEFISASRQFSFQKSRSKAPAFGVSVRHADVGPSACAGRKGGERESDGERQEQRQMQGSIAHSGHFLSPQTRTRRQNARADIVIMRETAPRASSGQLRESKKDRRRRAVERVAPGMQPSAEPLSA